MTDHISLLGLGDQTGGGDPEEEAIFFRHEEFTPHSAVSSFNFPLDCDASLTTPVGAACESQYQQADSESYSYTPWMQPDTLRGPFVSHHGLTIPTSSRKEMKYKTCDPASLQPSLTSQTALEDATSMSQWIYDSPQTQKPPTPHWGSFGVSEVTTQQVVDLNAPAGNLVPNLDSMGGNVSARTTPNLTQPTPFTIRGKHNNRFYGTENHGFAASSHNQDYPPDDQSLNVAIKYEFPSSQIERTQMVQTQTQEPYQLLNQRRPANAAPILSPPRPAGVPNRKPSTDATTVSGSPSASPKRRKTSVARAPTPLLMYSPPQAPQAPTQSPQYSPQHAPPPVVLATQAPNNQTIFTVDDLTPDDRLLKRLREDVSPRLSWKEIARDFNAQSTGPDKTHKALEMRYTRMREKLRTWTKSEIASLIKAKEQYPNLSWEPIAVKLKREFNVEPKWSKVACKKKWAELFPEDEAGKTRAEDNKPHARSSVYNPALGLEKW